MTKLKSLLSRAWNWLLGKTTIDERVSEVVKETKRRAKVVKEEVNELTSTIEEVLEQAKDVVEAARGGVVIEGKATKSKIREFKKDELIEHAKLNFGVTLSSDLTKTNIVNKIYELYNGVSSNGATKGSGAKSSGSGSGSGTGKTTKKAKTTKKGSGTKSSGKGSGKKTTKSGSGSGKGKSKK